MTREETKELIAENRTAVMQAYVDGKQIQFFNEYTREWEDIPTPNWLRDTSYRVKSETKCRPFKNADECWQEMLKHQPFGWVCTRAHSQYRHINNLFANTISFQESEIEASGNFEWSSLDLFEGVTFVDGAPFGAKEE